MGLPGQSSKGELGGEAGGTKLTVFLGNADSEANASIATQMYQLVTIS